MILTVTLNTALDLTYTVPALVPHTAHRVAEAAERPGGKGVNVARVLAALGHEAVVTGFAGGPTGEVLRGLLAPLPVRDALVPIAGATRRTVTVAGTAGGEATRFDEPGPVVSAAEWAALLAVYDELLPQARAVALCGSLPPGVHVGAYAPLVRRARAAGVPVLLDTSGEPLRRGIAARPDVVKPNAQELAALTGGREPLRATRDARRRGAHAVVTSLGADGLLAVTPDGTWQAAPRPRCGATRRARATRRWRACCPPPWRASLARPAGPRRRAGSGGGAGARRGRVRPGRVRGPPAPRHGDGTGRGGLNRRPRTPDAPQRPEADGPVPEPGRPPGEAGQRAKRRWGRGVCAAAPPCGRPPAGRTDPPSRISPAGPRASRVWRCTGCPRRRRSSRRSRPP